MDVITNTALNLRASRSGPSSPDDAPPASRRRARSKPFGNSPSAAPEARRVARQFGRVVASSPEMQDVFDVLDRFARTDINLTLVGETGSGKDLLAHAVHQRSARASGPFVIFDCGSVARNLAESEFLGHERGAFTGAVTAHAGAFERAHGGTLFLDEVAELPIELQPRLLRALDSRRVRRVGGHVDRLVDVRVIGATNRNLRADVAAGRFREDLFFRLAAAVVPVPPLRHRLDDMANLVRSLLSELGRPSVQVSEEALQVLRAHTWPGNIRELKNVLACAVTYLDPGARALEPHHVRLRADDGERTCGIDRLPLGGQSLHLIERAAIRQTMEQAQGNKMHAARKLGIAVSTLYEKLKKHGL